MKRNKDNRGITLIALVVTIIVLLILAGVSINMLTGQNGILTNAAKAKENTEVASDLEFLQTKAYEAVTNYYVKGQTGSENEYILEELGKVSGVETSVLQGTVKYNGKTYDISEIIGNTNEQKAIEKEKGLTQITAATATDAGDKQILSSTDSDGNAKVRMIIVEETTGNGTVKAVIPSGFYYVTGKPSTGLVISDKFDDDDNNSKGGNQFVWVPCGGTKGVEYEEKNGLAKTWKENYSSKQWWYTTYQSGTDSNGNGIYSPITGSWSDDGGKTSSVDTYGGFYIARYEAGVPSNAPFYANTSGAKYETSSKKNTDQYIPVSKKNNQSWNYISQANAKTVSANMYKNSTVVTSQLVDSYAWDTVVQWMEKNESYKGIGLNSSNYGNYYNNDKIDLSNALYAVHRYGTRKNTSVNDYLTIATKYIKGPIKSGGEAVTASTGPSKYEFAASTYDETNYNYDIRKELATGSAEETKINNIYDMAGNMWEWTTETGNPDGTSTTRAVLRGGSFHDNGSTLTVSGRSGAYTVGGCDFHMGFRVVLYIQ